jgi:hypothetical protein
MITRRNFAAIAAASVLALPRSSALVGLFLPAKTAPEVVARVHSDAIAV